MPKYPAQIDNTTSLPTVVDNLTPVQGAIFNKLRDAVLAIESELGVKPSATYTTVKSRIDTLEGVVGNIQASVKLGQDLGNTLSHPFVIGIQGRPVAPDAPTLNQVLGWNGMTWAPQNPSGATGPTGDTGPTGPTGPSGIGGTLIGDANGPLVSNTVDKLKGTALASSVGTVGATQDGYSLVWDNTNSSWHPVLVSSGINTLGGDATGPIGSNTVAKINGTTVTTAGGALTTGKVLRVTGAATSDWGAVDLANSNSITGILPTTNQAPQTPTLTGDIGGTTAATVIGANKVLNTMIRQSGSLSVIGRSANSTGNVADIAGTNNQVLRISGSVLGFGAIDLSTGQVTGTLPTGNQASQSMGGDISGTTAASTVNKLKNVALAASVGTVGATQDGYSLVYVHSSTSWQPVLVSTGGGGSLAGDVTGPVGANTVVKINGSSVSTIGASNTVLGTTNGTSITYFQVANAQVSSSAAIVYSKLSLSNSILNADINTAAAIAYSKLNLATSIVNADVSTSAAIAYSKLNLSGSIVNADVSSSAAITVDKLANSAGLSVLGRAPSSTGAHAAITGANNTVLRVSGSALGFGAVDLSTAQVTGTLPTGNQASQTMGGDVTGTTAASTVIKLNGTGVPASPSTDQFLRATSGTTATWQTLTVSMLDAGVAGQILLNNSTPTPTWTTVSGDSTISTSGIITVVKINGTTITSAGGALTTGKVLRVTGVATADYGAVDLANANAVTGVLPSANQASQTMAGDVTGTTATSTVVNINSSPVSTIGSANTVLGTTDGSSITYFQISNAQVNPSAAIAVSKLANSAALSVLGRSANTSGVHAAISTTAASDAVLRESGSVLGFGTIATGGIADNAVTDAKLRQGAALTVIGRSANSTGNVADISGANNQVLRISGSTLGFGAVDLSTAQVTGVLPSGNQAAQTMGGDVTGTTATSTVVKINGSSVTTIGSSNTVLGTTDGTSITYFQVANAQVSPSAAIAYSKLNLSNSIVNADVSTTAAVDVSKLADSTALSVLGRSANSTGAHADIAGTNNQALRVSGSVLGFGTLDLSTALFTGVLPTGNQAAQTMGGDVTGTTAASTVVKINGSSVTTIGSSNTVLGTTDGTSITYFQIANAQISTSAAINKTKLENSAALSVVGRNTNSTGVLADISATASSGAVLRESGSTIGFGTVGTSGISNNAIDDSKLRQGTALSVIGRASSSTGNVADISGADDQVLRISGSTLGFGAIDLSTAQVTGVLPAGNQAAQTTGGDISGTTASSTVDKLKGKALAASVGTVGATQDGYSLVWDNGTSTWAPILISTSSGDTLNGDVTGTTGANTVVKIRGIDLATSVGTVGATEDGYSLVYVNSSSSWQPVLISTGGGDSLGGDVTGPAGANTVSKINGSSVTTIGSANTMLGTTDGSSITYFQVANAQVSSSAAIAYSKLNLATSIVNADIATAAAIAVSKLANSTALSVLGRSANSTGAHADISGSDNQVLRISSSTLGFGAIDLSTAQVTGVLPTGNQAAQSMSGDVSGTTAASTVVNINGSPVTTIGSANTVLGTTDGSSITYFQVANAQVSSSAALAVSKLADSTALSVLGRSANSTGAHADIAGADNQVLRVSGSVLGFGAIDLSTAQVTGILPDGNQAAQTMGGDVGGTTAASTVNKLKGTALAAAVGTVGAPQDGYSLVWDNGTATWKPSLISSGATSLSGDVTGPLGSNTVVKINGSSVTTIGSSNTVLGTTNGTSITYFQIADAQVSSSAAIAYSKLSLSNSIVNADINTSAAVDVSKLADSTALSVLGRSANSTGAHADIAGANNQVLRVSGSTLGFGAVDLSTAQVTGVLPTGNQASQTMAGDVTGTTAASVVVNINGSPVTTIGASNTVLGTTDGSSITYFQVANAQISSSAAIAVSKLANSTALSVLGRSVNSSGVYADVSGTNNQVLRISGSTLGFGAIDLSTAQVTGVLPDGNQAAQTMGGDVSGTTAASTVDKLKGKALDSSVGTVGAPQDGYALIWDNGTSTWKPSSISTGSTTLSGDVTGPSGTNTVTKVRGNNYKAETPGSSEDGYVPTWVNSNNRFEIKPSSTFSPPSGSPGQTLVWNGSSYVPAFYLQDDVVPPYEFQIDNTTYNIVQVGETITQGFHVNFDTLPDSAVLTDSEAATPKDVLPELTIDGYCVSDVPYTKPAFGDTVTYTITAVSGHVTKTTTADLIWGLPAFYGVGAAGQTGSVFIFGLDGYVDTIDMNISFPVSANSTEKVYFACRSAYGDVIFTVYNIEGGFTKTQANVSLTSVNGWTEDYDLYESNNLGLGSLSIFVHN